MAKRVIYQIDPKRRNTDGSFPEFVFKSSQDKHAKTHWLYTRVYKAKRDNAKKAGIYFCLRFLTFLNFCRNTRYPALRGQGSASMTIDRIDNLMGYTDDNIQMLSNRDNVRKYFQHDIKRGKREMG